MDYSKLSNETLAKMAQGHDLDYSKLSNDDLQQIAGHSESAAHPSPPDNSTLATIKDLLTGAGDMSGVSQQVGGAAQAIPDLIQSTIHDINPDLADRSPSQVNESLASMGIKGDVGPTSSAQMYKQGTKDVLQQQDEALKRSPIAYRAGEALGLGTVGLATAGLAPELVGVSKGAGMLSKLAASGVNAMPAVASYGALNSSGSLIGGTPEEQAKVLEDGADSALLGAGLGVGGSLVGQSVSKILGKVAKTDTAKNLIERYKIGKEGKSLGSEESQLGSLAKPQSLETALSQHETRTATRMLDGLNQVDDKLGQNVGKSLADASDKGVVIKSDPGLSDQINKLFNSLPDISIGEEGLETTASGEYGEPLFKNLSDFSNKLKSDGLKPDEVWKFRNELGQIGKTLKNSSNASDRLLAAEVFKTTNTLGGLLRQNVPEYGAAASRMEEFRRLMPETILSKDNPVDVTSLRMSGTRNVDTKLLNNMKRMISGMLTNDDVAQGSFTNLLKGMQELNASEMERKASGKIQQTIFDELGLQPQQIEQYIKQEATRSKVLQTFSKGPKADLGKVFTEPVQLATKGAGYIAEKAGNLGAKNPVLNVGTKLYNASDETLKNFADNTLNKIPGQSGLATALNKAIENKDPIGKNAILFSIMQNPNLRNLVESNNLELEPR